jgi:hypothetical protein
LHAAVSAPRGRGQRVRAPAAASRTFGSTKACSIRPSSSSTSASGSSRRRGASMRAYLRWKSADMDFCTSFKMAGSVIPATPRAAGAMAKRVTGRGAERGRNLKYDRAGVAEGQLRPRGHYHLTRGRSLPGYDDTAISLHTVVSQAAVAIRLLGSCRDNGRTERKARLTPQQAAPGTRAVCHTGSR